MQKNRRDDLISLCTSDTPNVQLRPDRTRYVSTNAVELIVSRGMREGWVRPKPYKDLPDAFRRRFDADLSMDCEAPFEYTLAARFNRRADLGRFIALDLKTRCRKCDACRARKSMYWAARAQTEFEKSPATYMVTLTMRPEEHYLVDALVAKQKKANGLASAPLFQERATESGKLVTRYLKRLRKRAPFRCLLVTEAHKEGASAVAGRPHFHLLIHEKEYGSLISPDHVADCDGWCSRCNRFQKIGEVCDVANVRKQWPHGFTRVVRCHDARSAMYLCKYISKSMASRVRASLDYGKETQESVPVGHPRKVDGRKVTPKEETLVCDR